MTHEEFNNSKERMREALERKEYNLYHSPNAILVDIYISEVIDRLSELSPLVRMVEPTITKSVSGAPRMQPFQMWTGGMIFENMAWGLSYDKDVDRFILQFNRKYLVYSLNNPDENSVNMNGVLDDHDIEHIVGMLKSQRARTLASRRKQ